MSEECSSPVLCFGHDRRRLKSRLLFKGRATPVNEIAPEALQNDDTLAHAVQEFVFPTKKLGLGGHIEARNETEKDVLLRWVIPPTHGNKIKWDFFLGFLILYSVMILTFRLGFSITPGPVSVALDIVIDVCFFIDMILSFRCTFVDSEGVTNTIPADIRKQYFQGFFVVDFLSTMPIDWLLESMIPGGSGGSSRALKIIRFARLFRLLKLARVFKMAKLVALANSLVEISPVLIKMATLAMKISFMAHMVGCFWFYLTSVSISKDECLSGHLRCEYQQPSTNWYEELGSGADTDSDLKKYIITLYWVFTTMTTVGYGDITPTNDLERAFAVVVMIFGATVFGYIIGSIAEISSGTEDALSHKLCILRDFCDERGLNKKTQGYAHTHYAFWYEEMTPGHDEPGLLCQLPPSLRKEVILNIHRYAIRSIALFKRPLPDWFVAVTVRLLEPQAFSQGSDVVSSDEAGPCQDIIFIQDGVCEVYQPANIDEPAYQDGVGETSGGSRHRASVADKIRRKKQRRRLQVGMGEEGECSDEEDLYDDRIIEVIGAGMVWGCEHFLTKAVEGVASRQTVCLRCGQDEPCYVFTLRQGLLAEILAMQMDYGRMLQEVLSETIVRQATLQNRHRPNGSQRKSPPPAKASAAPAAAAPLTSDSQVQPMSPRTDQAAWESRRSTEGRGDGGGGSGSAESTAGTLRAIAATDDHSRLPRLLAIAATDDHLAGPSVGWPAEASTPWGPGSHSHRSAPSARSLAPGEPIRSHVIEVAPADTVDAGSDGSTGATRMPQGQEPSAAHPFQASSEPEDPPDLR